ncbi:phospholipase D/nuclease [Coniochaeta ligniaria NRRL 30616]|uniref:Phospholipase D/nuclease n=1 Tax=Coniochaeta ligniaria NRRL 30616 TaxID=1408157 RepID=A0A1J7JVA7_9PEZI|nr:phospholipase D/nuclease [Coniochaeta ligniaria NRRL 30616]
MVFIIDLPKIEDAEGLAANQLTPFGEDLIYFLEAQGVPDGLIRSLAKYDFSETARYGFVHSIAGSHADDSWRKTGYCGLGRTVNALGLSTTTTVDVDIVTSSLGAVTYDFLQMIYNACQGDSGLREYGIRTAPKSKKTADGASVAQRLETLRSHLRVYFPSEKTIEQSVGGKDNAGTIFFHSRWWNQTTFPKAVMRDCRSKRPGMLMHSKVLYVRQNPAPVSGSSASSTAAGFAYVGSANLSESAWGRLVKDRASGQPRITCRNWECGVVVPVLRDTASAIDRQAREGEILGIFNGYVPVPMQTPGAPYVDTDSNDSRVSSAGGLGSVLLKPWFQG